MTEERRTYGEFIEFYKDKNKSKLTLEYCQKKYLNNKIFLGVKVRNENIFKEQLTIDELLIQQMNSDGEYVQMYVDFCKRSDNEDYQFESKNNESVYEILKLVLEGGDSTKNAKLYNQENNKYIIFDTSEKKHEINPEYFETILNKLQFIKELDDKNQLNIFNPSNNRGGVANQKWHFFVAFLADLIICDAKEIEKGFDAKLMKCIATRIWIIENSGLENQINKLKDLFELNNVNKDNVHPIFMTVLDK